MLPFKRITWIVFVAKRVRKRNNGTFPTTIAKIVALSIAIGTAALLIALMVLLGFQKEITKKITTFSGDFEITKCSGLVSPHGSTSIQVAQVSRLMASLPSAIEKVTPFTQTLMLIHTREGVEGICCKGIDPMVVHAGLEAYLISGRLPHLTKATYENECCISHYLAQRLSIALGDSVLVHTVHPTVRYRKLKIVGIYCTYLTDIDENLAFCDMRLIQRLHNWSAETVNGYTIFLKDQVKPTKTLRNTILGLIDSDLRLIPTQRKYVTFYDWLAIIQKNTTIFTLFILFVAACTMVATLIVQLMERSYMIGILKILGASNRQIYGILLYNSLRTLCMGMLYGNFLGLGCCFLQAHYKCIRLEPALYYMAYVPIYSHWKAIVLPNLLILATLFIALYFGMKWLKQKKIIDALQER